AIGDLVHAAAPGRAADVAELAAQTGGNPFFVREVIAHRVESDWEPATEAPAGLREVIAQRVARLSEPTREMLTTAAVAGPRFSFALLECALGDESQLLDALEEAVGAGLIRESGPDEFVFAHALVRTALYESLGLARRTRLHRKLGEALEALGDP